MIRYLTLLLALICIGLPGVAKAACTSPSGAAGDIVYNTSEKYFQYCNDTNWVAMNAKPGSGAGGCTNPTLDEGQMAYNADNRVLQGCAGNIHVAMGPTTGAAKNQWSVVTVGDRHICGIKDNSSLWCWGTNWDGRLGDGTSVASSLVPVMVSGSWKQVSAGEAHTCGIKVDDTLWCWGGNGNGQLGDNTTTQRLVPTAVNGGGTWKKISAGRRHSCGIKSDDTLHCWGGNFGGQLGDSTTTQRNIPTAVNGGGSWKTVVAGYGNTCAIKSDDTLRCWGVNFNGTVGDNTTTQRNIPTAVSGGGTWKDVSTGMYNSCGIKTDNSLHCWGYNTSGQVGDNTTTQRNAPTAVTGGGTWKKVTTSVYYSCAVNNSDNLYCWGSNSGMFGNGNMTSSLVPVAAAPGVWKKMEGSHAGEGWTSCGIKVNGDLLCWGWAANQYAPGMTGNNLTNKFTSPVPISGGSSWKTLRTGTYYEFEYSCGIKADDSVHCWGSNTWSQLGDGTTERRILPTALSGGGSWLDMKVSTNHACGLKSDNTLYCWGGNFNGQLGDNTTTTRAVPTAVNGGGTWKQIGVGGVNSCAIKSDDTLHCWGPNTSGQIGDNTTTQRLVPTAVSGGGTWKQVQMGLYNFSTSGFACAIKSDDSLYCWGLNSSGQLGDNTTTQRNVPTAVSGGGTWKQVSAGYGHACGIKMDDTLWCWGGNSSGQLGDNTTTQSNIPIAVSGGGTWKKISAGGSHTCGIKMDDTLWCWGSNWSGKLGDYTEVNRLTPVPIEDSATWSHVSSGGSHTCGVKTDGSGWCWGGNWAAQLGNSESSPIALTGVSPWCGGPAGKAGTIVYNSTESVLQYCAGTGWVGMGDGAEPVSPSLPTSGLIAYWAFNEGAGTNAADSSGNGNNGTLIGGTTWTAGRVGSGAISLDGINDYVDAGSDTSLDDIGVMSTCAWVYPTGNGNGSYPGILDKSHSAGWDGWNLYLINNGSPKDVGFFNNYDSYREVGGVIPLNTWTHVCSTWSGGAAETTIEIYVNGTIMTSFSTSQSNNSFSSDAGDNLVIGLNNTGSNFHGYIDEVRIYDRVLTALEISALAAQ